MDGFGPVALVILLGARPGSEDEISAWHAGEHMAERLAVPGFRRGRRGISDEAAPAHRFLVIYEADTPGVFESPAYLARLDAPTAWTRRIFADHVAGLTRTVCRHVAGSGTGVGGWAGVLVLRAASGDLDAPLAAVRARRGVTGAHALAGTAIGQQPSAEKDARGGLDATIAGAVLVEGTERAAVEAALGDLAVRLAADLSAVYRLQHVL